MMLRGDMQNLHLSGELKKRIKYSSANHVVHAASTASIINFDLIKSFVMHCVAPSAPISSFGIDFVLLVPVINICAEISYLRDSDFCYEVAISPLLTLLQINRNWKNKLKRKFQNLAQLITFSWLPSFREWPFSYFEHSNISPCSTEEVDRKRNPGVIASIQLRLQRKIVLSVYISYNLYVGDFYKIIYQRVKLVIYL